MGNLTPVSFGKEVHHLDLWKVLMRIWELKDKNYSKEFIARELSKEFDISVYYAGALVRKVLSFNEY